MAKALYLLTDLSPMNLSIDLYNRNKHNDKTTQKKLIKIKSTKRNQQKDYKRKCYTNHIK